MDEGRMGIVETLAIRNNLEQLGDKDKEILYLFFWKQMPQAEIAKQMNIPIGTVKSRLYVAKQKFREKMEGEKAMKRLPEYMPKYVIVQREDGPFAVKWEELMGWFLVPKLGEEFL